MNSTHIDADLRDLVLLAKKQGFLTYDQVNDFLPDECEDSRKLEELILTLEENNIQLVEGQDTEFETKTGPTLDESGTPADEGSRRFKRVFGGCSWLMRGLEANQERGNASQSSAPRRARPSQSSGW